MRQDYLKTINSVKEQRKANRSKALPSTNDLTYYFTNANCQLIPQNYVPRDPIYNVQVSRKIIPDHDTINTTNFQAFLVDFFSTFAREEQ